MSFIARAGIRKARNKYQGEVKNVIQQRTVKIQ